MTSRAAAAPLGSDLPLVAESTTAAKAPDVVSCDAPDVPTSGGPVDLGSYATPEEALEAFVGSQVVTEEHLFGVGVERPTITDSGYTEITLPDGSIAYADEQDHGVPVVIHATQVDDGWTVDRWEASGC